jgi:imidazoleglycerol phosphate dehydratase HisB
MSRSKRYMVEVIVWAVLLNIYLSVGYGFYQTVQQQANNVKIVSYYAPSTAYSGQTVSVQLTVEYNLLNPSYVGVVINRVLPNGTRERVWHNPDYEVVRAGQGTISYSATLAVPNLPGTYEYMIVGLYWDGGKWITTDEKYFHIQVQELQRILVQLTVTDRQGRPLTGWRIRVTPEQGIEVAIQGNSVILWLPVGRVYTLSLEWMSTYGTVAQYSVQGSPEEIKALGKVILPVDDVLIKVVDFEGRPVAGAAVKFAGLDIGSTDSEGMITVGQVPLDNDYIITVVKGGVEVGSDRVRFTASRTSATVQVGIYDVTVVVTDTVGRLIQGALIEIIKDGVIIARTVTDASGSAVFGKLISADYVVRVSYKQFMAETRLLKGTRNAQITLDISVGVVLSILDRQGRPLEGTKLRIVPEQGVEIIYRPGSGEFVLKLLEGVTYDLTIEWTSPYDTTAKAVVQDTPAGLQAKGRITVPVDDVSIKVVDLEGRPVAGAAVKFAGKDVGSTDSQGVIIVGQVPLDNDYTISVSKEGTEIGSDRVRFTASRTSATIQAGIYDITVLVKGAVGQPIQGALVELIKGGTTIARAATDASGTSVFTKVVGADYEVRATYEPFTSKAALPKGTRSVQITLDLYTILLGVPMTFVTLLALIIILMLIGVVVTLMVVRIARRKHH